MTGIPQMVFEIHKKSFCLCFCLCFGVLSLFLSLVWGFVFVFCLLSFGSLLGGDECRRIRVILADLRLSINLKHAVVGGAIPDLATLNRHLLPALRDHDGLVNLRGFGDDLGDDLGDGAGGLGDGLNNLDLLRLLDLGCGLVLALAGGLQLLRLLQSRLVRHAGLRGCLVELLLGGLRVLLVGGIVAANDHADLFGHAVAGDTDEGVPLNRPRGVRDRTLLLRLLRRLRSLRLLGGLRRLRLLGGLRRLRLLGGLRLLRLLRCLRRLGGLGENTRAVVILRRDFAADIQPGLDLLRRGSLEAFGESAESGDGAESLHFSLECGDAGDQGRRHLV